MTIDPSRRQFLRAGALTGITTMAGCGLVPGDSTPPDYAIRSLEVVNAHPEPHDVIVLVTADGTARFTRSVHLSGATESETGVDSVNRWWDHPVDDSGRYRIHVAVDDRSPRTHQYSPTDGGDVPCLRAIVWIDRDEGEVAFRDTDCDPEPDA